MKKIFFSLVVLVATMSMNAQVMKVMKNGVEVAKYNGAEYSVVFEEEAQGSTTTGTAKRTGDIEVKWVQLWENGPKFAEYNVGAKNNKAEDCGGYYAWGGSQNRVDDHNTGTDALTGDNDTATKLWGSRWRMPTNAEFKALLANCTAEWTTVNGMNGFKFTGKGDYKDCSVFLPAAGDCSRDNIYAWGIDGNYWSSTPERSYYAYSLNFCSDDLDRYNDDRGCLYSVRAVLAE